MTQEKHTPAPWRINSLTRIEADEFGLIASVRGDLISPMTTANARLIAAAPELLESLEGILDTFADLSEDMDIEVLTSVQFARNAIAKAKGGAA